MSRLLAPRSLVIWSGALVLSAAAGCAGTGEVRTFDLQTAQSVSSSSVMESVKIVIEPFEDQRSDKTYIGSRSHLWGGATYFDVAGGKPADVIAQALAHRLRSQGWGNRGWNVHLGAGGAVPDADIVISGQVQEFSANAKSRMFSTVIDTKYRLSIQARNLADNSTTTRTIEGTRTRTVFWFDEEDVRELLADTMNDGIDRLIADTTIAQKTLRPIR